MSTSVGTPLLRTPLTDVMTMFECIDIQTSKMRFCREIELKYFNCMEAYGVEKGFEKCNDYREDLTECIYKRKQMKRLMMMREEREKKFKEGKLTKKYEDPPEADIIYNVKDFNEY